MEIKCLYDELVEIEKLTPNPKNNNRHSPEQIQRLAKIIEFQGFRSPIVVSVESGHIVHGHCRLEAAKTLGYKAVPVNFQNFPNENSEFASMTSDNEIARWAELDLHMVYTEIEDKEFEFDLDLLGIENFNIEPEVKNTNEEIDTDNFGSDLSHECPKCGFEFD